MADEKQLVDAAVACGADKAAVVAVANIGFDAAFREACAMNSCGMYGRCWMCPPDVGAIEEMITRASAKKQALIFQTIGPLEDSFDFEGMEAAGERHNTVTRAVASRVAPGLAGPLVLGAGACRVCKACSRVDNEPCRHPQKAIASLESYGIAVADLARTGGMRYTNGENTVTYFGAVLYD